MLRGFIKTVLTLGFLTIVGYFAWQYGKPYLNIQRQVPQETKSAQEVSFRPLKALVLQQGNDEGKRLLACDTSCQTEPIPHSFDSNALFDGESWYYYQANEDDGPQPSSKKNTPTPKISLVRYWPQEKQTKTIAQETDLIKPRNAYLNPTGTRLAYFLDNKAEPQKHLTELWIYDAVSQSVSLVAEHIYQPDILTRPRWNAAGNALWFIADSGAGDTTKIELVVISPENAQAKAAFQTINWASLVDTADHGVMDISQAGDAIAYVKRSLGVFDRLVVTKNGGQQYATSVTGSIPYIEWLADNSLLYAVQDTLGFTFWRVESDEAVIVASQRGVLRSARSDPHGEYIVFAAESGGQATKLSALHIASRTIKPQTPLTAFGDKVFVVGVKEGEAPAATVASVAPQLADDHIAAFIDANLTTIVQDKDAKKVRLIITDESNTIYVDYKSQSGEDRRILLTIRDVINVEWSIRARYEVKNAQWQKVQGGGISDPKPVRLYEWEESLKKWVLKTQFPN
ncbi:MAG: hypothetical protein HYZ63_02940 [Candidatus Andersenbacteria bacterium]|nr:hypothetical protein [Candidatus Andersenbacteria bacterium]